ncbi:hypothetical protein Sango_2328700 [Sesamum angolense]|uniref:Uncharacterized protein n=1 Tax=Sesamum angolense TaxID=2727404 RepID=A0AAE1WAR1_9LAMI|nr:hypothetical protein Sango_2328700 [Sesamum angolense]
MRAALMWTVNDLPTYGMMSGWSTASVMGCPIYMDDTRAFHLQHGTRACYFDWHRQFLPTYHSYRRNIKAFTKNRVENKVARPRLTGDQILDPVANISPAVEMSLSIPDSYGSNHKWTKKSVFWDLHTDQHFLSDTTLMSCTLKKTCLTIYPTRSWTSRER